MAAAAPYIVMFAASALKAGGEKAAGDAAYEAGKATAAQYVRQSKASIAEGTRRATEIRRQGAGIVSDAEAAIAAGGGVTDDAGSIEQLSKLESAVDYNSLVALFEGENLAQQQRFEADMARFGGKVAKISGKSKAITSLGQGASSAYAMKSAES